MTNFRNVALAMLLIVALTFTISTAWAVDEQITSTIDSVITKLDKNGDEYARIVVTVDTSLANGVAYKREKMLMVFGELAQKAKLMTAKQTQLGALQRTHKPLMSLLTR